MEFNPDPTKQAKEVLFSCKKVSPDHPDLMFNGTPVTRVDEHTHLGLTLKSNLSFDKHLNEKMIKAKKNIGILKLLSKFLPLKTLDQIYKAIVRSHLDYCDIIGPPPQVIPPISRHSRQKLDPGNVGKRREMSGNVGKCREMSGNPISEILF